MADRTVLLVEDNPDDIDLVRHAFRKAGISASLQVVDDGDKAVAYIGGEGPYANRVLHPQPRLILLDLKLPRRSGFDVLTWARAHGPTMHTPIVVLTSSDQDADIKRAYGCGANSYLTKPVGRDALVSMLTAVDSYWLGLNRAPAV